MNTILETKDLKKYFQIGKNRIVHATDGLSVTIGENEIVGLVGESGSGKSTFGKPWWDCMTRPPARSGIRVN
jgi:oligopeptide transport system ATP-binding protein